MGDERTGPDTLDLTANDEDTASVVWPGRCEGARWNVHPKLQKHKAERDRRRSHKKQEHTDKSFEIERSLRRIGGRGRRATNGRGRTRKPDG